MKIILEEIEKNNNFLFTRIDYKKNRPQLKVKIDKNKASNLLISNFEIGRTLESKIWKKLFSLYSCPNMSVDEIGKEISL